MSVESQFELQRVESSVIFSCRKLVFGLIEFRKGKKLDRVNVLT